MAHDVFISYSSKDKPAADATCAALEARGIRCWMAPRDIGPGEDWGAAIIRAIGGCRVMVLLFTSQANDSLQVKREVERAVAKGKALIPLRLEDVALSPSLEYFISTPHWLDAMTPPLQAHLGRLVEAVRLIVGIAAPDSDRATRIPNSAPAPVVAPPRILPPPLSPVPPTSTARRHLYVLVAVILLATAAAYGVYLKNARPTTPQAMYQRGLDCYEGHNRPQDAAAAASWWRKAADAGYAPAMTRLGNLYDRGEGVDRDPGQAVKWWQAATDGGEPSGMVHLGLMYEAGKGGLARDPLKAAALYRRAADAGDPKAMACLGLMYMSGRGGLAVDAPKAVQLFRRGADLGNPSCMLGLANLYDTGQFGQLVPKDDAKALELYEKAGDAGSAVALVMFADHFLVPPRQNPARCAELYRRGGVALQQATDTTDLPLLADLGFYGQNDWASFVNDPGADDGPYRLLLEIFLAAYSRGDMIAGDHIGEILLQGHFHQAREDSDKTAVSCFQRAADGGNTSAMCHLAKMYLEGRGGLKNDKQTALTWYRKAADRGNEDAKTALRQLGG